MNKLRFAAGAVAGLLMLLCSGCSSQQSGVTMSGSQATRDDCTVDLKEICDSMMSRMTHSDFTVNGENFDQRSFEQNNPRHQDLIFPYNYPDGSLLATVRCQFDTVHNKVTSATLAGGPPIDDKAIDYIRSQGFLRRSISGLRESNARHPEGAFIVVAAVADSAPLRALS